MRLSESEFKQLSCSKKPTKPKIREVDIQNAIRDQLRWHGWFVIRHQQGLGSLKGLSDLTALKDGQTVYIEVKTPTGRLSEYQEQFKAEIESRGGLYIVARSVDDVKNLCGGGKNGRW